MQLLTKSLAESPGGESIARIMSAALQAVDPYNSTKKHLQRTNMQLTVGKQIYNISKYQHIYLIGVGKASVPMAKAGIELLGDIPLSGVVITKHGHCTQQDHAAFSRNNVQLVEAGHPIPDQRGVKGAQAIINQLKQAGELDLVLCLISGGASALMVAPQAGLELDHLQKLTALLLASGANINQINSLRKHLEQLKGGGLARFAAPAEVLALVLSDVVGDPLDVIASGPCVPDPSTFQEAMQVLQERGILNDTPRAIIDHLQRGIDGQVPETPKHGDPLFDRVHNIIIGSNLQAAQGAMDQARIEGFNTLLLTTYLQGEARQIGRALAGILRQTDHTDQPVSRPACIIAGGETTVTIEGDGLGGRNQELALSAVADLSGLPDIFLVTLATDGGDGPTDAAGAVVTGSTLSKALAINNHPSEFLARNDSYHFFEPLGDLLKTGATQTNVNDLAFLFAL